GWYPVMMFGLVGADLAMMQEAKPHNKKAIGGIMISAAFTSFLTGITEPIEFAFMFISPFLYGLHAVLSGISMSVVSLMGIKHGFGFSAGLIDYVLNWNLATNPIMLIPVGLAFGALYYVVFRFAIRRFNLATPGREEETEETAAD
ncbi:MAG TPA: PTS transporter subunit EIIC, partial [Symbiobacteriaceae bacterium]|nr:PTS transporter subunit EIIC [Symbiobacteriaceae bacterium]